MGVKDAIQKIREAEAQEAIASQLASIDERLDRIEQALDERLDRIEQALKVKKANAAPKGESPDTSQDKPAEK
jgi:hypothetical protein